MTETAGPEKMQIEVWADIICPWCGLGDHRLRQALDRFNHRDDVEVIHRSFQLDPEFPPDAVRSVRSVLKAKYAMDDDQIEKSNRHLEQIAAAEGLSPYVVLENEIGNTALAHELLAFAADRGLGEKAWAHLFAAHFGYAEQGIGGYAEQGIGSEVRSVFDLESLVTLGVEIGLSDQSVRTVLGARIYAQQIEDEAEIAKQLGATGVPFFVFDRRYAVAGARSPEALLEVVRKAYEEYRIVNEALDHAHQGHEH